MYKKVDIFVFSGTGNTYKAAEAISEISVERGIPCEINVIDVYAEPEKYEVDKDNLLGLMSSTLGFIQPLSFFKFVMGLPKGGGMNAFIMATGAWTKIGKIFIPGFCGFGPYLAALILVIKGYRVAGIDCAGMPHNWTAFIPPYWRKLENRILNELRSQINNFASGILDGKRIYRRKADLILGILLFPVPLAFIIIGHFALAKSMFANHRCSGCGLCRRICPNNAIKMLGRETKRPYWTLKCEQCMRCTGYCPNKAVEGSLPMLVIYCLIFEAIGVGHIIRQLHIDNAAAEFAVYYLTSLLVIVIGYMLFIQLNRIKIFNKIFTYSTFTFYWRKYKEPTVDIKKLNRNINL